jgi:hypothetical protein
VSEDTRSRIVFAAMELRKAASTSLRMYQNSEANSGAVSLLPGGTCSGGAGNLPLRHHEICCSPRGATSGSIERIFALLARYRELVVQTECFYGCPIGSLALELHEPDPPVRELLAANFLAWTEAVQRCIVEAGEHLPRINSRELAEFVLTTMEGAVMQSRTFRDVAYFDRSVSQLRAYFELLATSAAMQPKRGTKTRKRQKGK